MFQTRLSVRIALAVLLLVLAASAWPARAAVESVTVETFFEDVGTPATAGVRIFVNGTQAGTTGDDGTFTLPLETGRTYQIRALVIGLVAGTRELELSPSDSGRQAVQVVMQGETLGEESPLRIDEVSDGVLDAEHGPLHLSFTTGAGELGRLSRIDEVNLYASDDLDRKVDVKSMFAIDPDGRVVLRDVSAFRAALLPLSSFPVSLELYAETADGMIYNAESSFLVGRFSVEGTLAAPPSNRQLGVGGLTVTATSLGDPLLERTTQTNADGSFRFVRLPAGSWSFTASTTSGNLTYNAYIATSLASDVHITVNLLVPADIRRNASPGSVTDSVDSPRQSSAGRAARREEEAAAANPVAISELLDDFPASPVTVTAVSDARGEPVGASGSLTVPSGTPFVVLRYRVRSTEYPEYVSPKNVFNDQWLIRVISTQGTVLSLIDRDVNSMLKRAPFWQPDSSTGVVEELIDVSALTATQALELMLSVNATNIGDDLELTDVTATLVLEPTLRIREIIADKVVPTKGGSDYYSIPRPGLANVFTRKFTLRLSRPQGAVIRNVRVQLLGALVQNQLTTIIEGAPGPRIREINPSTLEVDVTFGSSNPSTVASVPPLFQNILYRFTIEAEYMGTTLTDRKDSAPIKALWILPDTVVRKRRTEDRGLDGWCAKNAYRWLERSRALVPPVDDISGEHARNLGHKTHAKGTDIDAYHFTDLFPNAREQSGTLNYQEFQRLVLRAFGGDQTARTTVTDWIQTARTGLTALAGQIEVAKLRYHNGEAAGPLPDGWAKTLLLEGTLTDTMERTLDLGIGTYMNGKLKFDDKHNNHLHIDLDDDVLSTSA